MPTRREYEVLKPLIIDLIKAEVHLQIQIWKFSNPKASHSEEEAKSLEIMPSLMHNIFQKLPQEFVSFLDQDTGFSQGLKNNR